MTYRLRHFVIGIRSKHDSKYNVQKTVIGRMILMICSMPYLFLAASFHIVVVLEKGLCQLLFVSAAINRTSGTSDTDRSVLPFMLQHTGHNVLYAERAALP